MSMPSDSPMPSPAAPPPRRGFWSSKVSQIGVLLLATLLASWPIAGIIGEREARQAGLRAEFGKSWGPDQTVHAPILVVPTVAFDGQTRQYLKIAPETLSTRVVLAPEQKKRGLFSATVYTAAMEMTGSFPMPSQASIETLVGRGGVVRWDESVVLLQASDLAGMTARDRVTWGGEAIAWRSCAEVAGRSDDCQGALLAARPPMVLPSAAGAAGMPFQATLTLRGTSSFQHVVEGRQTTASIKAPWPTPSFVGTVLPSDSSVTAEAFEAQWHSVGYARPLLWTSPKLSETASLNHGPTIGVDLLEAVPTYRMINRVSKYAILFIVLSFTVYALVELLSKVRIHTVQYGLLGLSMTLFALLLVSFAEPLGYAAGYWISTALVLTQASLYTAAVTRRVLPTLIFAAALSSLFGFLYVLLSLETYSLLVGSVALFLVVSVVMAVTQRVDWRAGES